MQNCNENDSHVPWVADAPRCKDSITGLAWWTAGGPATASPSTDTLNSCDWQLRPLHPFRHGVNKADTEGRTYDQTGLLDRPSKCRIL